MRIELSEQRRGNLVRVLKAYYEDTFDEPLSDFRAEGLLDFFIGQLGPQVYNQGVRDARAFMLEKLGDLDGEVYEKEPRS